MSECANCDEPGHPGHHWLDQFGGYYVCERRPELDEDAPPPPGFTRSDPDE